MNIQLNLSSDLVQQLREVIDGLPIFPYGPLVIAVLPQLPLECDVVVANAHSTPPAPSRSQETGGGFSCITTYDPPPIPDRRRDWCASLPGADERGPVGWGRTKADAIADLRIELESR